MRGIKQHDMRDCGAACLATICHFHGLKIPLVKVREIAKVDKNGVNLYGMTKAAEQLGFQADALNGDMEELLWGIQNKEIVFPFVAHVVFDYALEHYIVVKNIVRDRIHIFDPAKGHMKLSIHSFLEIWSGNILCMVPEKNFVPLNLKKGYYSKFISIFFKEGKPLITVIALSLAMALTSIVGASLYQLLIDNYVLQGGDSSTSTNILSWFHILTLNIDKLFLMVLFIYVFQALLHVLRGYLISKLAKKVDGHFMSLFFHHVFRLPINFFMDRDTGEVMSRLKDISNIQNLISEASLSLAVDSAMIVVGILILNNISTTLFIITAVIILLYVIIVLIYRKPIKNINHEVMESGSKFNALATEVIGGIETIKSFSGEENANSKIDVKYTDFLNKGFKENMIQVSLSGFLLVIESIGALFVLWTGIHLVIKGQLTLGAFISFETLMNFFITPVKNLVNLQPTIQKAFVSADRLNDALEIKKEEVSPCTDKYDITNKCISFCNVSFGYGYREAIIKNINLNIHPKEKISFIGKSGSGKSTLAKLIIGLYHPTEGKITIGDMNLSEIPLVNLRKEIIYIPQETIIFNGSVMENIMYGVHKEVDMDDLNSILKACMFEEILGSNSIGLNSMISEHGRNLSGGQKQMIALVRSLLMKPSVLILDESTNQLDENTEKNVLQNIFSICKDTICIHITHNIGLAKYSDRIIDIEDLRQFKKQEI